MLNDRQEELLKDMILMCDGEDDKVTKFNLFNLCDSSLFSADSRSRFNGSGECRQMTNDFDVITDDDSNNYFVVSDKSGVYISNNVIERHNKFKQMEDEGIAKLVKAYKFKGGALPNQIKLKLEVE